MALSESTVSIMKACHPVLLAHRKAIGKAFYQLLFREHPDTQNLFNLSHLHTGQEGEPGPQVGGQVGVHCSAQAVVADVVPV